MRGFPANHYKETHFLLKQKTSLPKCTFPGGSNLDFGCGYQSGVHNIFPSEKFQHSGSGIELFLRPPIQVCRPPGAF